MAQETRSHLIALVLAALCGACSQTPSQLQSIRERGELRVATRNSPTTYFQHRDGETGLEYEMARLFARRIDLPLRVVLARDDAGVMDLVRDGQADIAAAGLRHGSVPGSGLMPGPDYQWVTMQVIYRNGRRAPASLDEIFPDQLHLLPGSLPQATLDALAARHPRLSWYIHEGLTVPDLLDMVEQGRIAYTVLPSNEIVHERQLRPELRAALTITDPEPIAWALPRSDDHSLLAEVNTFFRDLQGSGKLGQLLAHFQAPVEKFDYVDSRAFLERTRSRLPLYREMFEHVAGETGLDWRFLAAIGYQESHWDPGARSPTGVRGLMMLTSDTARRVGVRDRLDVEQSVRGGARYLIDLRSRIPARIPEPDRTWMALAAYNVGLGHLEDARILTQRRGGDPDNWLHVRESLPLLASAKWYPQTRHGYARGYEPVRYVRNIRRYYHVLLQMTQPEPPAQQWLAETPTLDLPLL